MLSPVVYERVQEHVNAMKAEGYDISLSSFISKALINQLENEGDFEIRDEYERELGEDEDP